MTNLKRLFVYNCAEIVQVTDRGQRYLAGQDMSRLAVLRPQAGQTLALATDENGTILEIGDCDTLRRKYSLNEFETTVDAQKGCLMPGFVDGHTHPIWSGDRVHEFAMKLAGASYMEIHKQKGGIHYTVECTRDDSDEKLFHLLVQRLKSMRKSGTTAAECKTGWRSATSPILNDVINLQLDQVRYVTPHRYGLWFKDELRLLKILNEAKRENIIDMSLTYLGAHAVPREFKGSANDYAERISNEDLPQLKKLVDFDNVDVFCEKGVFEVEATRRILEKAKQLGYRLNFHAEELSCINGVELGCSLGARAISHLEQISDEGISQMAATKAAAVVLPTTAQILRLAPPPVRKMIESGVVVALGSDFNPNAFCYAMPTVMHLACVLCQMSLSEALASATINAAYSIGISDRVGSLEVGKDANMILIKESKWEHIIYQLGCHTDLITNVIIRGKLID